MLETAIQENTAAIQALIALLSKGEALPVAASLGTPTPAAVQPKPEPTAVQQNPATKPIPEPAAKKITYQDLARVFIDKAKTVGTPKVLAAIAPLKQLKDVAAGEQHEGQYADLLAKLEAVQ
jgi:hypothetical protein